MTAWVIGVERVSHRSERVRGRSERVRLREMFRERERERERERGIILINQLIKIFFFFFFFFAFMNSTHLFLEMYCNSGAKIFRFSSTTGASF